MNDLGILVANRIEAMLAYWDKDQVCRYANNAYLAWFGKRKEEMVDQITMKELLGPIYELNLPYITGALNGITQQFEREIKTPSGEIRHSLANYYPDIVEGEVRGFSVHVADISNQKKAQMALRVSEEKYRNLVDFSPAGITLSTMEGMPLEANQAVLDIFGYDSKEEFLSTPIWENYADRKDRTHFIELIKKEGAVNNFEVLHKRKNGEMIWISNNVHTFKLPDGEMAILKHSTDITEQKKAQEALKNSEEKYRNLVNFSPVGISLSTFQGIILETNPATLQIFGVDSKEEFLQTPALDYYVDKNDRAQLIARFKKDGIVKNFEIHLKKKNGEFGWISNSLMPFKMPDGETVILTTSLDITDNKKAKKELIESKEKFQKIFRASPAGIVITTLAGSRYVEVNEAFCKITGYSEEEVIGRTSVEIGLILDIDNREAVIDRVKKNGFENEFELSIRHKSGNIINALSFIETIVVNDIQYAINIFYDITQRKKAEQQLEEVNKELEAFTYSVSHDLRAPLRAVNGYAQMLNEDFGTKLEGEGKRIIHTICDNAVKMGVLIDELLAFSKLGRQEVQRSKINMKELVEEVLADIRKSDQHKSTIIIGDMHSFEGDYGMFRQVMYNLIANALKYSSKKADPIIEIFSEEKQDEIIFSVKDNGAGFDMKYYDKLFGVFQRLHKQSEFDGIGVGLAIVQRIIAKHHGKVWAKSIINEGAVFSFSLIKPLNKKI